MNHTNWITLLQIISLVSFQIDCDGLTLQWDPTGKYFTQAMYKFLNNRGVRASQPLI